MPQHGLTRSVTGTMRTIGRSILPEVGTASNMRPFVGAGVELGSFADGAAVNRPNLMVPRGPGAL